MKRIILFGIVISILSCNVSGNKSEQKNNDEMFGLFKKKAEKKTEKLSHADYNIIFENQIVEDTPIELLKIGNLKVSSGKIVVCDPLVYSDTPPLSR
ncbi:MAG: hypothetical protein AAF828_10515, partial [Bacteroidota bacterium]